MTVSKMDFSDEELTAFLDGEADLVLAQDIETALKQDPVLAQRLKDLDIPLAAIRDAFSLSTMSPPKTLTSTAGRLKFPTAIAASVLFAFGVGGLGGYVLAPMPSAPGWVDTVAVYQSLYVTQTIENTKQSRSEVRDVLAGFASETGIDLAPATDVEGLDFKRAQVLSFNNKPLIQMAYLDAEGTPFALCVIQSTGDSKSMEDSFASGIAATTWVKNGVGYLVIGGRDLEQTREQAERVRSRLLQG